MEPMRVYWGRATGLALKGRSESLEADKRYTRDYTGREKVQYVSERSS